MATLNAISAIILNVNGRINHIETSTGIDENTKQEALKNLRKAKEDLQGAKRYIKLAQENFGFEF